MDLATFYGDALRRATYHKALGSGELVPQNERELRRSEGSGMLIGDPLR